MTEEKFEQAIENFFTWSWQTELIVSVVCAIALMLIGWRLFKKNKKNAGMVCAGIGVVIVITDIIRLLVQALF